jgi:hypothetical protein
MFRGIVNSVVFEMKQILKRDVNKRMVEATAFTALDLWWDQKEQSAKVNIENDIRRECIPRYVITDQKL